MDARRRIRRARKSRTISCGPAECGPRPAAVPAPAEAEARVFTMHAGAEWLATVVARLVSEDALDGFGTARLIVRFECLSDPFQSERVATAHAWSLAELPDETLRLLVAVQAVAQR